VDGRSEEAKEGFSRNYTKQKDLAKLE